MQTKARDRKSLKLARSAVAAAAGWVEHAETYLGEVTLDLEHASDLMGCLEKARQALHTSLSVLLAAHEDGR